MSFTGFTDTSGGSGTSYSPPSRTPDSSPDYSWDDDTNSTNGPTGAYDTPAGRYTVHAQVDSFVRDVVTRATLYAPR